jgi:fatty-acyl-CoA synthase
VVSFLRHAADAFADHRAIIHAALRRNCADCYARPRQLASALAKGGIGLEDTVAALPSATPAMLEYHFRMLICGAVLYAMNTWLDPAIIAFQLDHAMTAVAIRDRVFMGLLQRAPATVTPRVVQ